MHPEWRTFLQARGALIEQDSVQHFGAPQTELEAAVPGNIIADLSHLGLIEARGADAFDFLQGQLSNDLSAVSATRAQLSAWCSAQGRVLALMLVFQRDDAYYLQLPREILAGTLKRLRLYVLRAQVTLTDVSDALPQTGVAGAQGAERLSSRFGALPDAPYAVVRSGEISIVRLPDPMPRFFLTGPCPAMREAWETLSACLRVARKQATLTPAGLPARCAQTGGAPWKLLDIRAGLPSLHPATQDQFIPQMLNLDVLDAVSFTKGCYPGQEIVARTRHLGEVKRRLYRASIRSGTAPRPGAVLYGRDGTQIGQVISAQTSPSGDIELLAVIQISQVSPDNVHLFSASGALLYFNGAEKNPG
ncbi:MAG: folate-binding protein [Gammaproteobacteria bacterium]|nr:MAG: folate-binding protein [Gammaproteobacteria bacterium]